METETSEPNVTVTETNCVGLGLLDLVSGYERAIIIDAIQTRSGQAGQVYRLSLEDLGAAYSSSGTHGFDLITVFQVGTRLGWSLPGEVIIFAVEVADVDTFSEEFSLQVQRAIPEVVRLVLSELSGAG